ncbi:sugar O-acetyltransferase [Shouchella patagoniensis]|uniref:sugar O-acetyltransferase n=1 Tax=Shouchella patagoniensis TaxID=228576 RepID=UPI002481C891|nr:sugar O-acetyltransferase [Shouchella patagoniensis]
MTEKEKMLRGDLYHPEDETLIEERRYARNMMVKYNQTGVEEDELRKEILSRLLGASTKNKSIEPPFFCDYGYNIQVGDNFFANFNLTVLDCGKVNIGDNVFIGPNVSLYTPIHPLHPQVRNTYYEYAKPITIGDNVWVGGSVTVNGGVTIGENTVIGSGSVVTKDIPANVFAAGNPCRIVRLISESDLHKEEEMLARARKH